MRKVKVREHGKKVDGSCEGATLLDIETGRDVICPLSGRFCTPDCAVYQIIEPSPPIRSRGKVTCAWRGYADLIIIGELVEEAKP
jgi:hypothetical protein